MNMFKSILTGVNGTLSSKRVILLVLVAVFIGVIVVNLVDKTRILEHDLQTQLFELIGLHTGLVFGETAIPAWKGTLKTFGMDGGPDTPPTPPATPQS